MMEIMDPEKYEWMNQRKGRMLTIQQELLFVQQGLLLKHVIYIFSHYGDVQYVWI